MLVDEIANKSKEEIIEIVHQQTPDDIRTDLYNNLLSWFVYYSGEIDILASFDKYTAEARQTLVDHLKASAN